MRREISFWLLMVLMIAGLMSLGYVAHADEVYTNADIYRAVYEPQSQPYHTKQPIDWKAGHYEVKITIPPHWQEAYRLLDSIKSDEVMGVAA